jgi:mannose-6-phosphate isomerase-like protein (cupin superfamily)
VEKIIELESLMSQLEHEGNYFLDFVNLQHLQAGILRLQPREEDIQEPHPFDEIYFVIRGDGHILINNKKYNIKTHSFIYVPANTQHRFFGNSEEILVAYFFGN